MAVNARFKEGGRADLENFVAKAEASRPKKEVPNSTYSGLSVPALRETLDHMQAEITKLTAEIDDFSKYDESIRSIMSKEDEKRIKAELLAKIEEKKSRINELIDFNSVEKDLSDEALDRQFHAQLKNNFLDLKQTAEKLAATHRMQIDLSRFDVHKMSEDQLHKAVNILSRFLDGVTARIEKRQEINDLGLAA